MPEECVEQRVVRAVRVVQREVQRLKQSDEVLWVGYVRKEHARCREGIQEIS